MWDTKELYATMYHQKANERQGNGNRASQSQGSRPRKKHNLSVDQMLVRGEKKYHEKTNAGYFWFIDFEDDKYYVTKAGDAYTVNKDPAYRSAESVVKGTGCGRATWFYGA